jgi:hypothetical protein
LHVLSMLGPVVRKLFSLLFSVPFSLKVSLR